MTVWSERNEPYGDHRFRDCGQCAYLMALVYGGAEHLMPLGVNTVAEREAFERSDDRPDETGSNIETNDVASSRRYGVKLAPLPAGGLSLAAALAKPGTCLALEGDPGNLRLGHPQRRWQPAFTGGHGWAVVTGLGGLKCRVLDPLAPMGFAGDIVDNSVVLTFAWGRDRARFATRDQFASPEVDHMLTPSLDPSEYRPLTGIKVKAGAYVRQHASASAKGIKLPHDAILPLYGNSDASTAWRGVLVGVAGTVTSGSFYADTKSRPTIAYIASADVGETVDLPIPARLDCSAAVEAAVKPLHDEMINVRTEVGNLKTIVTDWAGRIEKALAALS